MPDTTLAVVPPITEGEVATAVVVITEDRTVIIVVEVVVIVAVVAAEVVTDVINACALNVAPFLA